MKKLEKRGKGKNRSNMNEMKLQDSREKGNNRYKMRKKERKLNKNDELNIIFNKSTYRYP